MLDDVVETIVIHFSSHKFNEVLIGSNDPFVHYVGISSFRKLILKKGIKDKVVSRTLFPSRDILDKESVCVEPRKENISHNSLNTFS